MGDIPAACQALANDVVAAQGEVTSAQKNLDSSAGGSKQGAAAAVKAALAVLQQKQAALNKCIKTTDLLAHCSTAPDCYYRLPFEDDPAWALWNGNWDDPIAGHNKGNPNGLQAFAYDFVNVGSNGQGQSGKKILAARPGKVVVAIDSEISDSWGVKTVYFFKGSEYVKFDRGTKKVLAGYPRPIAGNWNTWPSSWTSVDAAANWGNGKAYFFRGAHYMRWDIATMKMDSGYPKPIAGNWPNWPTSWDSVDDVLNWGNGKVYFFRKGEYLRSNISDHSVDSGYPKPLNASTWSGWPSDWESGIDAAINWSFGHAYFFKKDKLLRYIMSPAPDKVDPGFPPQAITASNWIDWPASWNAGIDAAVVWESGYLSVGNYLIMEHSDGTYGVYWHFEKDGLKVKVGDQVERGDWIGLSGETGNASTPHLHMDVRPKWDFGYPASIKEYQSIRIRFEDQNHVCWIPRVNDTLASDNIE